VFLNRRGPVTLDVDFQLTELEAPDRPLASVPVRLVLGKGPHWQSPDAGHCFVTGVNGEAHFTAEGWVDVRWRMVPYAMTGLSFPRCMDHITIGAELEQLAPTASGEYRRFQCLHTLDIDRYTESQCATSGITAVYTRDSRGWFTEPCQPVLNPPGYKTADFFLTPVPSDPPRKHWNLKLILQRRPAPVWRYPPLSGARSPLPLRSQVLTSFILLGVSASRR